MDDRNVFYMYVICLKWGTKYSADYVNKLYWGVRRNTAQPFRFVCFTDDSQGVCEEVECRELPQKHLEGWWHKVWFFSSEVGIHDRILYLDLDTVLVGPIDELLDFRGTFAILRDLYQGKRNVHSTAFGSGVMSWQGGWGEFIWGEFHKREDQWKKLHGDQQYLMKVVPSNDVTFWQDFLVHHGVCSYKADIRDAAVPLLHPPHGVSVVNFHGEPRPHAVGDLPWMLDHWKISNDREIRFVLAGTDSQHVGISALVYDPAMQSYYAAMEKGLAVMDGSNREQETIQVFRSIKQTREVRNAVDVVKDAGGRYVIGRGNQRICALRALGYTGPVPVRVWNSFDEMQQGLPSYEIPPGELQRPGVGVYPREHVTRVRTVNMPDGKQRSIPVHGSLFMTSEEYNAVATQIPLADYNVVRM